MNVPAFVGGLGAWVLLEYLTHRFLLHGPLLRLHLPHHAHPHREGFDWKPSLIAGVLAGYVVYSFVHDQLHKGNLGGGLQERHRLHHDKPTRNFGVTSSLPDRIFKTYEAPPPSA